MDQEIVNSLKNFDRVWERVSGTSSDGLVKPAPVTEEGDAAHLRRFISDAAAAAEDYRGLAQRTKGIHAKTLMTMAAEERKSLGRLQMEYYLLTGDTLVLQKRKPPQEGVLSRLRRCYMNEELLHRACMAASQQTDSGQLKALHRENAALAASHQKSLRAMISRAVG